MTIQMPVDNPVITGAWANSPEFYQTLGQRGHNGLDIGGYLNQPIYAAESGTIAFEGWGGNHSWMGEVAGICVLILHSNCYTGYAHMNSTIVNQGQWVARGQLIGYMGMTGLVTGIHLHFETLPLYPIFGNGFAGRVNPYSMGLVPRNYIPPKKDPIKPPVKVDPMIESYDVPAYKTPQELKGKGWQYVKINDKGWVTILPPGVKRRIGEYFINISADGEFEARVVYDTVETGDKTTASSPSVLFSSLKNRLVANWPLNIPGKVSGKPETRLRVMIRPVGDKPATKVTYFLSRVRFQE